jgi:REP element-mobilizing transposase RayT
MRGDVHFITSVVTAAALLGSGRPRDPLLEVLEQVRRRFQFVVVGYVIMPEHVHLLISEPETKNPLIVIQATKLSFTRRVLAELRRRRDARQASLFEHAAWQGCSRIFSEGYYPMSDLTSRLGLPNMIRVEPFFPSPHLPPPFIDGKALRP